MAPPPPLQPAGSADVQVLDKTVKQMLTELLLEIGNPADGPLADNLEQALPPTHPPVPFVLTLAILTAPARVPFRPNQTT